jgi:hypothetical protein
VLRALLLEKSDASLEEFATAPAAQTGKHATAKDVFHALARMCISRKKTHLRDRAEQRFDSPAQVALRASRDRAQPQSTDLSRQEWLQPEHDARVQSRAEPRSSA